MRANDLISFRHHKNDDLGLTAIWEDRKDAIEQIQVLNLTFCVPLLRSASSRETSEGQSLHKVLAIAQSVLENESADFKLLDRRGSSRRQTPL